MRVNNIDSAVTDAVPDLSNRASVYTAIARNYLHWDALSVGFIDNLQIGPVGVLKYTSDAHAPQLLECLAQVNQHVFSAKVSFTADQLQNIHESLLPILSARISLSELQSYLLFALQETSKKSDRYYLLRLCETFP